MPLATRGRPGRCPRTGGLDGRGGGPGLRFGTRIGEPHAHAARSQRLGDDGANPLRPGDESNGPLQLHSGPIVWGALRIGKFRRVVDNAVHRRDAVLQGAASGAGSVRCRANTARNHA